MQVRWQHCSTVYEHHFPFRFACKSRGNFSRADTCNIFFPFKHRFVKKWVYGVIAIVTWITNTAAVLTGQIILVYRFIGHIYINISILVVPLFVISVSYISVFVKIHFSRLPQHQGAASVRERKLTNTLFIVTLASFLTRSPALILMSILGFHPQLFVNLSHRYNYHISNIILGLYKANSLTNPIIYAMRMPLRIQPGN